jgi:hypothetical protein
VRKVPFFSIWLLYVLIVLIGFAAGEGNLRNSVQAGWSLFRNIELLLLYPLAVQIVDSKEKLTGALSALVSGLALAAMFGIVQTISDGRFFSGLSITGNNRYLGLFYHTPYDERNIVWQQGAPIFRSHGSATSPNLFASYLNIGLVTAFAIAIQYTQKGRHYPTIFGFATMLLALCLVLTLSRSGWVAAALAISFMIMVKVRPSLQSLLSVFLLIIALSSLVLAISFLLPREVQERALTIFDPFNTGEVLSRVEVWTITFESIRNNPWLGIGTDRVPGGMLIHWGSDPADITPHNIYLVAAYQYGVFHLLLLLIFLFLGLWCGLMLHLRGHESLSKAIGLAMIGIVVTIAVHGMFDSILQPPTMITFLWIMLALTLSAHQSELFAARSAHYRVEQTTRVVPTQVKS